MKVMDGYTKNMIPEKTERNHTWLELHRSGKSYNDIAFEHARVTGERISAQRVGSVVKKLLNREANI